MAKTARYWKTLRPTSLRDSLTACKDFALFKYNLGVERIAERMGLTDQWILYKYLSNGRMPAVLIPVYEHVCGAHYVTQWLAASAGQLLIDMPTGRGCNPTDMQALQELLHTATGELMKFYGGSSEVEDTLAAIKNALEGLGWHHGNVTQHSQPQLEIQ